jgi:hypothetical protein
MILQRLTALKPSGNSRLSLFVQVAFTGTPLTPPPMPAFQTVSAVFLAVAISLPAVAADAPHHGSCLTKTEQRAAVSAGHAISLAQAIKSLREHRKHSEVVRAQLCRNDNKLVYVLTLLGRSGKVVSANIDAGNGEFHIGR